MFVNKYTELIPNEQFYKFYESDLSKIQNSIEHFNNCGINEFHRISNVNYIKKLAKYNNYFVAGTIFGFNLEWAKIFMNYNLDYEYEMLEEGYCTNHNPTKLHAWEYYFGLITLLKNSIILGYDNNNLVNFYASKENAIKFPKYSQINVSFSKSSVAMFMLIPGSSPSSGGYRTLLRYVNLLNNLGIGVDLYFGVCWNDNDVFNNVHDNNMHGMPLCNNWSNIIKLDEIINNVNKYNVIDINKNNFYIGLKCQKKYDIIFANAWQIAEAVYLNKDCSKEIIYIIQDREELFYENKILQNNVLKTYHKEFKYYCVTKYLEHYFKNEYKLDKVYGSFLGVNLEIYKFQKDFILRENSVVIPYYKDKINRLPKLVEKIIDILSSNNIKCHVFPHNYDKINNNIINYGTLNELELCNLYNDAKVGIIFSNSNPSRLGYEMYSCGLNVIELDSIFTKYDMPNEYFTKINNEENILDIIYSLFNKIPNLNFTNEINMNQDYLNFKNFIFKND